MTIPVRWDDDDFFIATTLADAMAALENLRSTKHDYAVGISPFNRYIFTNNMSWRPA